MEKINELSVSSRNMNIRDLYRGINGFKRSYQPRSNLAKDENSEQRMRMVICLQVPTTF
jgi:NH3-dependent NAD+ synthetase